MKSVLNPLSVIIISWNGLELLDTTLSSLGKGLADYEIIVVDNGSDDCTVEHVRNKFPSVIVIANMENLGFAKAVNQGASIASGHYLLLLNNDTEVDDKTIPFCLEYLDEHRDVSIVGCKVLNPDGTFQSSCFRFKTLRTILFNSLFLSQMFPRSGFFNWSRYGDYDWSKSHRVDCVMGCFMMIRRADLDVGPLLDESYFVYGEEEDLCKKLATQNRKTIYLPDVSIKHQHSASTSSSELSGWAYLAKRRAILLFLYKWNGILTAWVGNLIFLLDLFPRAPYWLITDKLKKENRADRLSALSFHVQGLLRPKLLASYWGFSDSNPSKDG